MSYKYGFSQYGLLWYITDAKGRLVGASMKGPEQAKRLAAAATKRKEADPNFTIALARIVVDPDEGRRARTGQKLPTIDPAGVMGLQDPMDPSLHDTLGELDQEDAA